MRKALFFILFVTLQLPVTHAKQGAAENFDPYVHIMSFQVARVMERTYRELLSGLSISAKSCNDSHLALKKVRALRASGDYQQCLEFAKTCNSNSDANAQLVLLEGATCANKTYKFKDAEALYDSATSEKFEASGYQDFAVYKYLRFAFETGKEHKLQSIIERNPSWKFKDEASKDEAQDEDLVSRQNEAAEILALIKFVKLGQVETKQTDVSIKDIKEKQKKDSKEAKNKVREGVTEQKIFDRINTLLVKNIEWSNEMLITLLSYAIDIRYDYLMGLQYLEIYLPYIYELDRAFPNIFWSIYGSPANNYKLSRTILDVYYRHITPYSWFPIEHNIFTRSQVSSICAVNLAQGQISLELSAIRKFWQSGGSLEEVLKKINQLNEKAPHKADILTLRGSAYRSLGQPTKAMNDYMAAHKLCPYYHRAHAGIAHLQKDAYYKALDDYMGIRQRVVKEVAETHYPTSFEKLFWNWQSLSQEERNEFKHNLRFWAPYSDSLVKANIKIYAKRDFEYLSDIPNYESILDQRGEFPDNRSTDEIRGMGGNPVVTDVGGAQRAAHGEYNLAAHEVSHIWHVEYLGQAQRYDLYQCITKLYEAAWERNSFADEYSRTNEMEYFAEAVGYYLIPKGSPARFGLTVEWIEKNDPKMFEFIQSIERSKGDIKKVTCPVKL